MARMAASHRSALRERACGDGLRRAKTVRADRLHGAPAEDLTSPPAVKAYVSEKAP